MVTLCIPQNRAGIFYDIDTGLDPAMLCFACVHILHSKLRVQSAEGCGGFGDVLPNIGIIKVNMDYIGMTEKKIETTGIIGVILGLYWGIY